jgi:transposase-like protein
MKKVCTKCGGKRLHKHGEKRRKCVDCGATSTVQSGRPRTKYFEAYVLDRSTLRRIAKKKHLAHTTVLFHVRKELSAMPTVLSMTKNFL